MALALADAITGRLLRTLSLAGPTSAIALADLLALPLEQVLDVLRDAAAIGVVRKDSDDRYGVEPAVVAAVVRQNRVQLLGAVP